MWALWFSYFLWFIQRKGLLLAERSPRYYGSHEIPWYPGWDVHTGPHSYAFGLHLAATARRYVRRPSEGTCTEDSNINCGPTWMGDPSTSALTTLTFTPHQSIAICVLDFCRSTSPWHYFVSLRPWTSLSVRNAGRLSFIQIRQV
jgi:hypothetical protein